MSTAEQEVGGPGTALATIPEEGTRDVSLSAAAEEARSELEHLRLQGKALVERGKLIQATRRMLNGMVWGTGNMAVRGADLSEGTLTAVARVCVTLDADPALHINLLGNTLFLNAAFWTRELNQAIQDGIVRSWRLENISPRFQAQMRTQGEQAFKDADQFKDDSMRDEGRRYLQLSRYSQASRAFHEIPEAIEKNPIAAIYEVVISFPTDREDVREANYAPSSDRDPVGRARPGETARTRTLRRGAIKALPKLNQRDLKDANDALSAEWEIVKEDRKAAAAALPAPDGPQAVRTGEGEPAAANAEGAQPLPVRDVTTPVTPEAPAEPPFDRKDARKGFFATLRDAGVPDSDRKRWARDNRFDESTEKWTKADFDRAREILTAPTRDSVLARIAARNIDLNQFSLQVLGKDAPQFLADWKALQSKLDEDEDVDAGQL